VRELPQLVQAAPKQAANFELSMSGGFDANDRTTGSAAFDQNDQTKDFELSQSIGTFVSQEPSGTASRFNNPANREEKPLSGTGNYDLDEFEDDFNEYDEVEADSQQLNQVVDVYAQALQKEYQSHEDQPVGKSTHFRVFFLCSEEPAGLRQPEGRDQTDHRCAAV